MFQEENENKSNISDNHSHGHSHHNHFIGYRKIGDQYVGEHFTKTVFLSGGLTIIFDFVIAVLFLGMSYCLKKLTLPATYVMNGLIKEARYRYPITVNVLLIRYCIA